MSQEKPTPDPGIVIEVLPPEGQEEPAGPEIHPWRRFFARFADVAAFSFLMPLLVVSALPGSVREAIPALVELTRHHLASSVLLYLAWIPCEVLFLAAAGATPGKWLFGLRVERLDGRTPTVLDAARRSLGVWAVGLGLNIPVVLLVTQYLAYTRLQKTGSTWWDDKCATRVAARPLAGVQRLACAFVVLSMVLLMSAKCKG